MTAPGGLNYPPDMVSMETFIERATTLQGFGEDALKLCQGLVNTSAGQAFVAMQARFAQLNASSRPTFAPRSRSATPASRPTAT